MKSSPHRLRISHPFVALVALGVVFTVVVGCDSKVEKNAGETTATGNGPSLAAPAVAPIEAADDVVEAAPFRDAWESHYLEGSKIGHSHTTHTRGKLAGEPIVKIEQLSRFTVLRDKQKIEQVSGLVSWETPQGEVRRFESTAVEGSSPKITRGTVKGTTATYAIMSSSKTSSHSIPWPVGTRGPLAIADELMARPLKPGETRELASFVMPLNVIARTTLTAKDREATQVGKETRTLLRVDAVTAFEDGLKLPATYWVDDSGDVHKSEMSIGNLKHVALRTTASDAVAKDDTDNPQVDLGRSTMVKLAAPLAGGHKTTLVRYRASLTGGDAAATFPSNEYQTVKKLDGGGAEITVVAANPESPLPPGYKPAKATLPDAASNVLVQSDDPTIIALAKSGVGSETEPWGKAKALEHYVNEFMTTTEFSPAYASALDTAKSHKGDCTEYSVFLSALLRASGIPARGAIGLVYVEPKEAFQYHMWVEAYIGDRWVGLDATRGAGGLSGGYLKIADASFDPKNPYAGLMNIFNVVGRLKIEVLEAK